LARFDKPRKNGPVLRVFIGEPFRMELHAQEKREARRAVGHSRLQFHGFDNPIFRSRNGREWFSRFQKALMVRAVHA